MNQSESNELSITLSAMSGVLEQLSQQLKADKEYAQQEAQQTRKAVAGVQSDLDDFKRDVTDEIGGIKDSQYLEPWQAAKIQEAAKTRVAELLREWCRDNNVDSDTVFHKYYGKFVRLVHNDAKKLGLEIGKIIYTPKRNYKMLLEFIGMWVPKRGVEGQMRYYDKLTEAN